MVLAQRLTLASRRSLAMFTVHVGFTFPSAIQLIGLALTLTVAHLYQAFSLDPHRHITQYGIRVFKAEHGLPQTALKDVFQDSRGYIWIASQEGLARFDGVRFERFDRSTHPHLGDDFVRAIAEDWNGHLWFGTQGGGVSRFDGRDFTTVNTSKAPGLGSNVVTHIMISKDRKIRFGWEWGVSVFESGNFRVDSRSRELVPERKGNFHVLIQKGRWLLMHGDSLVFSLDSNEWGPTAMCERRSGEIVLGHGSGGLFGFQKDSIYQFTPSHLPSNPQISEILEDKDGNLWFATNGNGITRYTEGKLETLTVEKGLPVYNNFFLRAMEDREGSIWFVGDGGLLQLYDTEVINFGVEEGLKGRFGSTICQDTEGDMWAGLRDKGISIFNRDTSISLTISQREEHDEVTSILPSPDGSVWIGTSHNGLIHFKDGVTRRIDGTKQIRGLYLDTRGHLWAGALSGRIIETTGKTIVRYVVDSTLLPGSEASGVISIVERANKEMWFGTFKRGLFRLSGGTISRISEFSGDDGINAFHEDSEGVLWIATDGKGLYRHKANEFKNITSQNGLAFDRLFSILEDDQHNLWMSGNRGIFKVSKKEVNEVLEGMRTTVSSQTYSQLDGMRETECNGRRQPSAWKSRDGRLWFCSIGGIVEINPNDTSQNHVVPPVYIEGIKADGRMLLEDDNGKFNLEASERNLSFRYTALSFVVPQRVQFKYKLEGFDAEWIDAATRREAFYTNIPKGDYTFRVIACNNSGVWNEQGASIGLRISPFWWETIWAYAFFAVLVGSLLYYIRQFEMNRIRVRNELKLERVEREKLRELDSLKSRFFADITHEFRTPLTLILGPLEDLSSGLFRGDRATIYAMMKRNGQRLLGLINQLLDLSRLEAGKLELHAASGNIVDFLRGITFLFESYAAQRNIALRFTFEQEEIELFFDRNSLEKVIVNLLSNAFKFTSEGGRISIDVMTVAEIETTKSNYAEIRVADTGSGISPSTKDHVFDRFYQAGDTYARDEHGSGVGLALAKELVELHRGRISVMSELGRGTEFIIHLPLGKDHLKPEEILSESAMDVSSSRSAILLPEIVASVEAEIAENINESTDSGTIILVVDDSPDMRTYLREQLSTTYRVMEATDGGIGFEMAVESIPDLIISDVMMPKMDGYEFCRRVKADDRTNHIPVILLTARAARESRIEGLETGADEYITKPFDAKEVHVRIKNLIAQRRLLRERFQREITLQPHDIHITSADEKFLQRAIELLEQCMSDPAFSVHVMSDKLGVSRVQLHRKLKAITGETPTRFIQAIRLRRAALMLNRNAGTVSEVAYSVGFSHLSFFAKCFKEQFGVLPSEYKRQHVV